MWNNVKKKLPAKDGEYLVIVEVETNIEYESIYGPIFFYGTAIFSTNSSKFILFDITSTFTPYTFEGEAEVLMWRELGDIETILKNEGLI